ncbi:MAG: hypothetical protein AM326_12515 [Candidatus Thorarchaeota archaeon SMTZ-45]|nr:MAG: hypothetical protein AM326_12515 [Candidatus Thorarchaeota archaeon SMTZ-45]
MLHMIENLSGNEPISDYVTNLTSQFQPLSMSLFVFNDSLWKLMEKKPESINTMLPIVTIPRFYWKESAINPKNPHGVKRDHDSNLNLELELHKYFALKGVGGEFGGILEGRVVDQESGPRPIITPTFPGSKKMVPKYDVQNIEVRMEFGNLRPHLYPSPLKSIDYTFSEHPRVFYEHGLSVSSDGLQVQLGVGNKKAHPLHGDVLLLLGKRWDSDTPRHEILFYHVWLNALSNLLK